MFQDTSADTSADVPAHTPTDIIAAQDPQQTFVIVKMRFISSVHCWNPPMPPKWPGKGAKTAKPDSQANQASQGNRDTILLHLSLNLSAPAHPPTSV